jgi:hypothetical protein
MTQIIGFRGNGNFPLQNHDVVCNNSFGLNDFRDIVPNNTTHHFLDRNSRELLPSRTDISLKSC